MSRDNDKCFQCQKTSHMACYCPHIRCFDCNNYGHATVDCPDKIPPSGTLAWCRDNTSRTATPDILTTTIETDTDSANPDPTHTTPDIEVTVVVIPAEAILDHFIDPPAAAPHIPEVPAYTATAVTHHIADPHHIDSYPEKTVDQEHISPAGNIINQYKDHLPVHKQCPGNIRTEDTNRSQLTILLQNIIAQMNRIVTQRMI